MFKLQFETENDAFVSGGRSQEIARILRDVADRVERGSFAGSAYDLNGNRVGGFEREFAPKVPR